MEPCAQCVCVRRRVCVPVYVCVCPHLYVCVSPCTVCICIPACVGMCMCARPCECVCVRENVCYCMYIFALFVNGGSNFYNVCYEVALDVNKFIAWTIPCLLFCFRFFFFFSFSSSTVPFALSIRVVDSYLITPRHIN